MKKEIKERIVQISAEYIKASRKRMRDGVTSREVKEHIDSLNDIDLKNITSFNIGKILSAAGKFTGERRHSKRYNQDLNHWKLK
ncbi:hypothetical protein [Methanobacterium sp.]|uniref:hypothetical protein n=1 Tax=Methanobacterium sp. TaxID=2164 RepID=UPI003C70A447